MEESKVEDSEDWKTQLHIDSRNRVVNLIVNTLLRVLPISDPQGIQELFKIAKRFEDRGFSNSHTQSDYVHRISQKLMKINNSISQASAGPISFPYYPANQDIQLDAHNCQTSGQTLLQADYRVETACKIWDILKTRLNNLGPLEDALKMVSSLEEEVYSVSTSQSDYLHRLSLKILALEENSENSCSISNQNIST